MGEHPDDSVLTFPEVLQTGYEALQKGDCTFDDLDVKPEVPAAIIFTSGTTGNSKAVVLSHRNLSSNVIATSQFVSISLEDRLLSVLPLHHTYECTCGFLTALYQGATIFYAENLRRIQDNLAESRATVMLGVPLLFESFYKRIDKGIKERGEKKFRLAKGLAGLTEWVLRIDLRRRLFKELHAKLGGCLRLLISGGAAGNPAIARGFRALGVTLIQGYGLTETSPLISVNREGQCKDASVGRPIPGVEVRIVDGEIQVRGPNVMQGYYRNEAATQEVLTEGWLRTGDLGYLDQDGFLFINGRRKSLIVTPNGKNVYPEEIEAILNESPHILESLVWGGPEIEPSLVEVQAIVVPDFEAFDRQFGAADYRDDQVYDSIAAEVKKCNQQLAKFKRIKKFTLREEEFEKTTTRKIKRYLYTQKPKILA
jgi:long-chain acyl-CoA synthetase